MFVKEGFSVFFAPLKSTNASHHLVLMEDFAVTNSMALRVHVLPGTREIVVRWR